MTAKQLVDRWHAETLGQSTNDRNRDLAQRIEAYADRREHETIRDLMIGDSRRPPPQEASGP